MNKTKYKTGGYGGDLIEVVEVDRETKDSIFINGRRTSKRSSHHAYWDSWEEAYASLVDKAQQRVASARRSLKDAQDHLMTVHTYWKTGQP